MKTTPYRLPDGRIVQVDSTAAKDAIYIDYQLSGGHQPCIARGELLGLARQLSAREIRSVSRMAYAQRVKLSCLRR
jgi:hypothetical protein